MIDPRLAEGHPYETETLFSRDINGQLVRLDPVTANDFEAEITIKIDGQEVKVNKAVPMTDSQGNVRHDADGRPIPRATTIYDAARKLFVKKPGDHNPIPILCHQDHLNPVAVCRICVVEISKSRKDRATGEFKLSRERKLLPACQHLVEETMEIHTIDSPDPKARERVRGPVKLLTELLVADHLQTPAQRALAYHELAALAERLGVDTPRFAPRTQSRGQDHSSLVVDVNHDACILCDRCVRACDEVKKNKVIGRTGKGYFTHIGFDLNDPMGQSSCVSCGECAITCPTDALTLRAPLVRKEHQKHELVPLNELRSDPLFSGISYKFLEWTADAVIRRHVAAGDVLCREGDPGSTAFRIKSGAYQISIRSTPAHAEKAAGPLKWLIGSVKTVFKAHAPVAKSDNGQVVIRCDNGRTLSLGQPVGIRTVEDQILGEMTCMNHYPRSATVVATEAGEVWEIDRNVLYMLQRNPAAREILDNTYRERVLGDHLRGSLLFVQLDEQRRRECADFLRDQIELVRVNPGQTIFRQNDPADNFYLIRLGFVKVSQDQRGQEIVVDYLRPGSTFGEIGLVLPLLYPEGPAIGRRTATCTALDEVELVQVKGVVFRALLDRVPGVREEVFKRTRELLQRDQQRETRHQATDHPLPDFLDQGLFNAQKLLVLDLEACTRCDECTRACSDTHDGITRLIREGLRFDRFLVASSCRSCLDPYCLVGCPVDAIHRRPSNNRKDALEIVIEDHCIGCGQCAKNCPYGNINMHPRDSQLEDDPQHPGKRIEVKRTHATTCDLCDKVVPDGQPTSCVYACPHNAAFRMSGDELMRLVAPAAAK
jgi:CRP-like cAMP-binding protein/Fe-S-cluster-containing dehydrogenase component